MDRLFCQAVPGDDSRRRGEGRNDEEKEGYACFDSKSGERAQRIRQRNTTTNLCGHSDWAWQR